VSFEPMHEDPARALRPQRVEDRHSPIAAAVVNKTDRGGGRGGDERQKIGAAQPVLFVEARDDYADFRHKAKFDRPGILRPARASERGRRHSGMSKEEMI